MSDTSSEGAPGKGERGPAARAVAWVLGLDLTLRMGPGFVDVVAPYVALLSRVPDAGTAEVVIVSGAVLGYSDLVWGLSWMVLALVAVVYVPALVRPSSPAWPGALSQRLAFAVPVLATGLLAEAVLRRVLAAVVEVPPAPVPLPLDVRVLGLIVATTVLLFGWVWRRTESDADARDHPLPEFLVRGVVLVVILGTFFAEFSLLSPYSELLAVALYLRSRGSDTPADPVERLTEGVATVWERPAQVAMVAYVTSILTVLVLVVLAARFRAPPTLFAVAPLSTAFLVVIAGSALFHTYTYGERMLRRFRQQFDPETEPAQRVEGFLLPATVLVTLVLDGYVFGDPIAGPGPVEAFVGLLMTAAAFMTIYVNVEQGFGSTEDDTVATAGGIELTKSVEDRGSDPSVTFRFESTRDEPVAVRLTENLPTWVTPNDIFGHGDRGDGEWRIGRRDLIYEATIEPDGPHEFQYHIRLQEDATADDLLNGFRFEVGTEDGSRAEDRSHETGQTDDFRLPDYHLVPVAAGLFAALLGAVRPLEGQFLVATVLDGTVLALDSLQVGKRFGSILALVVLPYVPLGVYTHLAYREELHRHRGVELTADERTFAEQLRGTGIACGVLFVGVLAAVLGVPFLTPAQTNWFVAGSVSVAVLTAVRTGSIEGTGSQLFAAVWLLGKVLAIAFFSGFLFPLYMIVGVPAILVYETVS
jgi:hypothetical protein